MKIRGHYNQHIGKCRAFYCVVAHHYSPAPYPFLAGCRIASALNAPAIHPRLDAPIQRSCRRQAHFLSPLASPPHHLEFFEPNWIGSVASLARWWAQTPAALSRLLFSSAQTEFGSSPRTRKLKRTRIVHISSTPTRPYRLFPTVIGWPKISQ